MDEYERYIDTIDEIENRIVDDTKYPIITDTKIKRCCKYSLELGKIAINFLKYRIDAEKEKRNKTE